VQGRPLNSYLTEKQVEESIFRNFGKTSFIAKDLDITPRGLRNYLDEHNMWTLIEEAQDLEDDAIEDLSISAIEKLTQNLNDEPSVALNAAFKALTKSGSKRKRWVPDSQLSSQEVAVLKQMLQNEIGTPHLPRS